MSTSITGKAVEVVQAEESRYQRWQTLLFWSGVILLVIVAIGMRLYQLGLPFDRDGYDEGVYWSSLRAMSAGYPLYGSIFYSQPPAFLLLTFPAYVLFGGTLWSARLSIALISLVGLPGAFLLGRALSGRIGALAALLLVVVDPLYLAQSQTIQAEVSSAAFSLLAGGLAYYWFMYPYGRRGLLLAILTGVPASLSILCKLLGVTLLVPVVLLLLAHIYRAVTCKERVAYFSLVAGILAFVVTLALFVLPFIGSLPQLIQGVLTFHNDAGAVFSGTRTNNTTILRPVLFSLLGLTALYGTLVALLRRDWRVLPLLGWLLVTTYLLWRQAPLFPHHLIALSPPLIGLAVMGIAAPLDYKRLFSAEGVSRLFTYLSLLAIVLLLVTAVMDARQDRAYYRNAQANGASGFTQLEERVASDLQKAIRPEQWVITDQQFIAGLAGRNTPPSLVDTSMVRIETGYVTLQQLEDVASQPQVHAVLFFSGRFSLPQVAGFHAWVAQHFHLLHNYGGGRELWIR